MTLNLQIWETKSQCISIQVIYLCYLSPWLSARNSCTYKSKWAAPVWTRPLLKNTSHKPTTTMGKTTELFKDSRHTSAELQRWISSNWKIKDKLLEQTLEAKDDCPSASDWSSRKIWPRGASRKRRRWGIISELHRDLKRAGTTKVALSDCYKNWLVWTKW